MSEKKMKKVNDFFMYKNDILYVEMFQSLTSQTILKPHFMYIQQRH